MKTRIGKAFGRKLHLGRLGIPIWTLGLAVLVIAAVAGQTVGGGLGSSPTGSVGIVVNQGVTFDPDVNPTMSGQDDGVAVVNNEAGTSVRIALESFIGQRVYVCLPLQNSGSQDATAILEMNPPAGLELDVEDFDDKIISSCGSSADIEVGAIVSEARMDQGTWLLDVGSEAGDGDNDGVRIMIKPADQPVAGVGFEIRLNQVGTNR